SRGTRKRCSNPFPEVLLGGPPGIHQIRDALKYGRLRSFTTAANELKRRIRRRKESDRSVHIALPGTLSEGHSITGNVAAQELRRRITHLIELRQSGPFRRCE